MNNLDRYIIIAMFTGYMGKLLLLGAGYADVGIVLVIAAAHFLYNSQIQNKEIVQLKQDLEAYKKSNAAEQVAMQKIVDEHRTYLTSIKMSQGIRNVK